MSNDLKILYLEDEPLDAELISAILEDGGLKFSMKLVDTERDFVDSLRTESFDLVLADYAVPGFGGLTALHIVRDQAPLLPFIFVSGSMGEEAAVETLRSGASDYILKDNPQRLIPAILRSLDETRIRRERVEAEEALRASEQRLELALKGADLGLWDWNVQSGHVVFNERWANMLEYELDQIDPHIKAWERLIHPEDAPQVMLTLSKHLERKSQFFEAEYRMQSRSGGWKWVFARGKVVERDPRGKPLRASGTHLDITERKEAAEKNARLELQLQQAQKMEALGTLAGGIAHDFNNILGAIIGYTELVRNDLREKPAIQDDLQEVLSAANRAKMLVEQILTFSRQQTEDLKPLKLTEVVDEAMRLLRASLPTTIQVQMKLNPQTPHILGEATQIHQIVMNLATNSAHALPDGGGCIEIHTDSILVDESFARDRHQLEPGCYALLVVRDDGHGMDESTQSRVFDPFFTTKGPGAGTGLGMAVVHGIVTKHRGFIDIQSQPGYGTTIKIYFPATDASLEALQHPTSGGMTKGSGQRILFIDDEASLAKVGRLMLERLGYEVTMHTNSQQALEAFETSPTQFDLVVTDQTMPQVTGLDLAEKMRALRPDLPIILATGYHASINQETLQTAGIDRLMLKPYTLQALGMAVEEVLRNRHLPPTE